MKSPITPLPLIFIDEAVASIEQDDLRGAGSRRSGQLVGRACGVRAGAIRDREVRAVYEKDGGGNA